MYKRYRLGIRFKDKAIQDLAPLAVTVESVTLSDPDYNIHVVCAASYRDEMIAAVYGIGRDFAWLEGEGFMDDLGEVNK